MFHRFLHMLILCNSKYDVDLMFLSPKIPFSIYQVHAQTEVFHRLESFLFLLLNTFRVQQFLHSNFINIKCVEPIVILLNLHLHSFSNCLHPLNQQAIFLEVIAVVRINYSNFLQLNYRVEVIYCLVCHQFPVSFIHIPCLL